MWNNLERKHCNSQNPENPRCLYDNCLACNGTGNKQDGSTCNHFKIKSSYNDCDCPKCNSRTLSGLQPSSISGRII